jgi:nonspecific dipeptidase
MEESGSEGLDELLWAKKNSFLNDVDYVCISDNYWLGTKKPCITYGLRGICYFMVEVICADKDLHSGTFGGCVHEAMADLIYLMNSLVDVNGKILVDDIYNSVAEITNAELATYKDIEFDVDEFRQTVGTSKLPHREDKVYICTCIFFSLHNFIMCIDMFRPMSNFIDPTFNAPLEAAQLISSRNRGCFQ